MDKAQTKATVLADLRRKGCTCQPNIIIKGSTIQKGKALSVRIQHDDWCPFLAQVEGTRGSVSAFKSPGVDR
jgi:hypothetical protein